MTSNPKKLAAIGKELDQLSKIINDLTPVSEMPFGARCKSRKEKNKLASRACRLKKKAQHEANKLKCEGLAAEHSKLADTDTCYLLRDHSSITSSKRWVGGVRKWHF